MTQEQTDLRQASDQYQRLVNKKYVNGLSSEEENELARLFSILEKADEPFYRPIIERLKLMLGNEEDSK